MNGALSLLKEHPTHLNHLMHTFDVEGCNLSQTFKFWDIYISDLSKLLDYIAAKKTA